MKANRAYELNVTRSGAAPAWLAAPARVDHVEVVEVASGEVVLFWDLSPRDARRLARRLREEMAQRDAEDFVSAWVDRPGA